MKWIGFTLMIGGILNFVVFAVIAGRIGGSFDWHRSKDGHYYVSDHGKAREVTREVYEYSRRHSYSLILTHPLAMIGLLIFGAMSEDEKARKKRRN